MRVIETSWKNAYWVVTLGKTVLNPNDGSVIIKNNEIITEDIAKQIIDGCGIEIITIRSVFTCNTKHGVCKHCYGRNLRLVSEVEVG